jgi:hypothetical protein
MPERKPADLVREWQEAMLSMASAAASAAGGSGAARQLLAPIQRQAELVEQALEQQRKLQADFVDLAFRPLEEILGVFEQSSAMMRDQAEALAQAAAAFERTAGLIAMQAQLFETATQAIRRPTDIVKSTASRGAGGAKPRQRARKASSGRGGAPASRKPG